MSNSKGEYTFAKKCHAYLNSIEAFEIQTIAATVEFFHAQPALECLKMCTKCWIEVL